jgi:muramoyltetrapeptide carboxypeptidase
MQIPAYLKKGDTVAIIATARKISEEEIKPAIAFLEIYGLNVICGAHLYKTDNQFAGTDEQRASDLQWALDNKEIKAIIIARGGYGTMRLLEHIDFTEFKKHPKWLVGYSDVTVLHSAIHQLGVASLHATMPLNFSKNKEATKSLVDALFGTHERIELEAHFFNKTGKATGELVGGNLSLLFTLSGTPYDIDTTNKILFIEDLDEYLYHIDRMMMQLKLSGKLKHLAGLVIGGMTDMKDNAIPFGKTEEDIILDAVKEYNYPVCFDFPAGHLDRNLALYFGRTVELNVQSQNVSLKFID